MECCQAQVSRANQPRRNWRGIASCAGSGAMLVLLPKCPMCIAAYLAVWTGLGLATSIAAYLRMAFASILLLSLILLLFQHWRNAKSKTSEASLKRI